MTYQKSSEPPSSGVRTYSFDVFNKKHSPEAPASANSSEHSKKSVSADRKGASATKKSVSADLKRGKTAQAANLPKNHRVTRTPEQLKHPPKVSATGRNKASAAGRNKASEVAQSKSVSAAQTGLRKKSEVSIHTVSAQKVIPLPTAVIFMTLIATLLFMFMIMSYVRINEYTIGIESLESQKSDLAAQVKELTLELEKKNNLKVIEEYATNVLGMVKIDQLTKKYITIQVEDKIEVVDEDKTIAAKLGEFFESLRRNFSDLFKYVG